jgi:hypothetical protein
MTTRNAEKWLAVNALALEAAAVAFLCGAPAGAGVRALLAAFAHLAGAASAAMFLSRRSKRLGLASVRGAWLLFAATSFLLPVIGPVSLAALLARVARRHDQPRAKLARAPLSDVASAVPLPAEVAAVGIGRGSLEARLRFDPAPASRIAAVLATRRLPAPADAARLLKVALRDRQEDVRLLAHALLEDRDRQAFRRIDELERELATAAPDRRGAIACLLAEALCDLCAAGLVSGELESFTLRRARALLEEARQAPPAQASARAALLLGQVLLRQRDATAARAAIEESGRLGAPPALLAPLAAEASFQAREAAPRGGRA